MKDSKALGIIQGAITDQIFPRIANAETSKEAWELLYKEFHGGDQVRSIKLQSLRREFECTKMKDDETLSNYLIRLNDLINQMKTFGETLSNERMVKKVLISLTKAYEPICLVIENTKDLTSVEFQEVIAILKSQEQRLDLQVTDSIEKAFSTLSVNSKIQNKGVTQANVAKFQKSWSSKEKKWKPKQKFRQRFHGTQMTNTHAANTVHGGNRWQVGGSQDNSKPQCKTYGLDTGQGNVQVEGNQMELTGNMFYAASKTGGSSKSSEWYIDSGCSNHMTGNINLLIDVKRNLFGQVQMPNGTLENIAGKGTLVIDTDKGKRHIKVVLHLPGLKENLLSVGQMEEHGYYLIFGGGMCHVYDGPTSENLVVKVEAKTNRCYPLTITSRK
ncbi:uncharacterized protein LOC132803084 [Ziziphus jujuba]|uniref:Uncharacterized protein LOC132803084 n=1 Tax=Ziziphus jujuba TaxID=326968 RepID=A0ABM4A3J2_ZIZJJ|nr:uncharacterized protein LOC132803084 [Ziziphus jujuba]